MIILLLQDPYVALDLEWRPEFGKGQQNKVAMIQLASSTVAVLIRTSKLGFKLEPTLEQFLRYVLTDCMFSLPFSPVCTCRSLHSIRSLRWSAK